MDVNAEVESIVIVIGVVIPAPVPVRFHPVTVAIDRPAVLAVSCRVTVDSSAIVLEPLVAVISPIVVGECGCSHWKS